MLTSAPPIGNAHGAFSPPDANGALAACAGDVEGGEILRHLQEKGEIVDIGGGLLFHGDTLQRAEELIRERIASSGELVSSDFRDLTGTTRKFAIPLLEYFDTVGLTVRLDNKRVLRDHGPKTRQ